jgi:hypothetical protein
MSLSIRSAAVLLCFVPAGIACSCAAPPPPCQAYWQTPAVFLGTVTEILASRDGFVARARMRIDHAYKGVSIGSITLFDDGMCDGPNLKVGEQYLMYTQNSDDPKADIPSRGCTRSRSAKYATEDFEFLNGLADAPPTGTVQGQAVGRTDMSLGDDQALPGSIIEVHGVDGTYTTTADAAGRFSIRNLNPATYDETAKHPGYSMLEFPGADTVRRAEVHAGGCADIKLILIKEWRGSISGRLVRTDGSPGPKDVPLMLIRAYLDKQGAPRSYPGEYAETDEQGRFSFRNLAPGRYKIVMNAYNLPSSQVPYPTIYWPSGQDEDSAREIEIKDEDPAGSYDFQLPRELRTKRVNGTVLLSDSKPAAGVSVIVTAISGNRSISTEGPPVTDNLGQFSFIAAEETDYNLTAILRTQQHELRSPEVRSILQPETKTVMLILEAPSSLNSFPRIGK